MVYAFAYDINTGITPTQPVLTFKGGNLKPRSNGNPPLHTFLRAEKYFSEKFGHKIISFVLYNVKFIFYNIKLLRLPFHVKYYPRF